MTKPEVPTKRRSTRSKTVVIKCKEDLLDETPRDINGAIVNNTVKEKIDSENLLNEKGDLVDYSCRRYYQEEPKYSSNETQIQSDIKQMSINSTPGSITDYSIDTNDKCNQSTGFSNRSFNPIDQTETITKSLSKSKLNTECIKQTHIETNGSVLKTSSSLYKKRDESSSRTFCFSELISAFQAIEKKAVEDPFIANNLLKKFKGTEEQYCCDNSNSFKTEEISFPSIRNNPFMKLSQSQTVNNSSRMFN